jgi:uncharacterized repeat protein (TIGR01451 family)
VPVAQSPAIQIEKTYVDVNGGQVLLGDALTYTFTVTNTGNVTLYGVTVNDPLPGLGAVSPGSVASLAPGASAVFTAAYTVTQADLDQTDGMIDNTATATGTPPGGGTVSDDDTLAVPVAQSPAIQIEKTYVDVNGGQVLLGDALTYTFTVTNTGNVTLYGVTVNDPLPGLGAVSPGSVASLAPGASAVFTASYTVTQGDMLAGSIYNTATARGEKPGGIPGDPSDDITATDDETVATAPLARLRHFVWHDEDADGIQDAGEPGVPGAAVTFVGGGADGLISTPGDNTTVTVTTDQYGYASLAELIPGVEYQVRFTLPSGYVSFTRADVGGTMRWIAMRFLVAG